MPTSQGRQPRFRFTAGAAQAIPLSSGWIDLNRFAEAGTYEVQTPLAATGLTLAGLNGIGKTDATIEGSNDGESGYKTILKGVLDKISVRASAQPGQGGVMVVFRGRDLTAKLIDTQRTEKSLNKSSAEIVKDLAAKHGLKVEIDPTPGEAGQQHTQDFAHLIDNDSDWNTIAALAEKEGAYLYIAGILYTSNKPETTAAWAPMPSTSRHRRMTTRRTGMSWKLSCTRTSTSRAA